MTRASREAIGYVALRPCLLLISYAYSSEWTNVGLKYRFLLAVIRQTHGGSEAIIPGEHTFRKTSWTLGSMYFVPILFVVCLVGNSHTVV